MLAPYFEQFATRSQKMDLLRFLVELLGKQRDRFDHVLTAIENDKKLLRANELDQFQAGIFRFEYKSQRCRDGLRNMPWIGKAFQVNKMDFPGKLLGNGAGYGQGDGRLANATGAEQCYEPLVSKLVANLGDDRFAPNHRDRSHGEPALLPDLGAFRATSEGDNGADERIAPSLDVCDISIAELAVTKRLADSGHVDSKAPFLDGYARPDVIHQLLLRNNFTWAVGKIGQNIQRPIPERKHSTVAPEEPLVNRKFKRAEPQLPVNYGAMHMCQPMLDLPSPAFVPSVGKRRNCARVKLAPTKLVVLPSPLESTNDTFV